MHGKTLVQSGQLDKNPTKNPREYQSLQLQRINWYAFDRQDNIPDESTKQNGIVIVYVFSWVAWSGT